MISVVIPCHNSAGFVSKAIDSVLNQTHNKFEIILVENNSSDNTVNILNEYQLRYPEKIRVTYESKKGAPAARNRGLREAAGEWIQFLDSDDELLPAKLEMQFQLGTISMADLVSGSCYIQQANSNVPKVHQVDCNDPWQGLLTSTLGRTSSNLWRREAVLAVGGWDETKTSSQEYDLIFRMFKQRLKIVTCAQPLAIIHLRDNSIHVTRDLTRNIEIVNNYVQLRQDMKKYLRAENMMTNRLENVTDISIYDYLMNHKPIIPEHVSSLMEEMKLNVPFTIVIRRKFNKLRVRLVNGIKKYCA